MRITRQGLYWGVFWGAAALVSTTVMVSAFNPQPDPPGHYFGLMTVEYQHDISIHVANTKSSINTKRAADSMCTARLEIVNACGQVMARRVGRISPAQAMSLNFTVPSPGSLPPGPCADPPGGSTGLTNEVTVDPPEPDRMRLRAQVLFSGEAAHCISSVEVGDPFVGATGGGGGSGFIHPGLISGFNPQPEPPGDRQIIGQR